IRAPAKNDVMDGYMDFRMKNAPGVSYDDTSKNYSWDWGPVHLVQGNLWAGKIDDLDWLRNDLANNVGSSGRPVILFQHFGWDAFSKQRGCNDAGGKDCTSDADCDSGVSCVDEYWSADDRTAFKNLIGPYNVIGVFSGHRHAPGLILASDPD